MNKKKLKEYGFSNIFDYYFYILDSEVNGNFSQVRELILALSKQQKKDFIISITVSSGHTVDIINRCKDKVLELI